MRTLSAPGSFRVSEGKARATAWVSLSGIFWAVQKIYCTPCEYLSIPMTKRYREVNAERKAGKNRYRYSYHVRRKKWHSILPCVWGWASEFYTSKRLFPKTGSYSFIILLYARYRYYYACHQAWQYRYYHRPSARCVMEGSISIQTGDFHQGRGSCVTLFSGRWQVYIYPMIPMRNYHRTDIKERLKIAYDHRFRIVTKKREAFQYDRQKIVHIWWKDWPTEDEVRTLLWSRLQCVEFHRSISD